VLIRLEGGCLGSGFFVATDLIATNKHVLACGGRGTVSLAGNRRTFPITATWADPQHDLALVRVAGADTLPLTLSARGWPAVGDDIYVAGNPAGLEGTFSAGIVSGLRQSEGLIQFDAPVSPGSSGGPVVDARGQVVGVTVSSVTQGQNLNFAVSAQYLPPLIARARRTAPETAAPGTRRQPAPVRRRHPRLRRRRRLIPLCVPGRRSPTGISSSRPPSATPASRTSCGRCWPPDSTPTPRTAAVRPPCTWPRGAGRSSCPAIC
jgi:S1-C subfamily serine protease